MDFGILDFLNLFGALGFFIFGMKVMSEGIQKVAGSKMRSILSSMTSNRIKGVFTGFTITSLVQSSSATTVLVVSFVNAGLLSLVESIGVIMGANIGTTLTAWLIAVIGFKVKISTYALPIIAIGFPLIFFNRERARFWGEVLVGFALLFMGLSYMKETVPDLNANPEILAFLSNYTNLGFVSTLIFVAIGTIMTIILQSSSATMALTLVMANNGWISFELAAAMVLGENIGTTITANLAALVANVHAKRAAFAHFIFNIFGTIWIVIILSPVLRLISNYMVSSGIDSPFLVAASIPIGLSIFHTSFNIANTALLIGFTKNIANLVTRLIKPRGDEEFRLAYISAGLMNTAELSIEEARKETIRFGEMIMRMAETFKKLLRSNKPQKQSKLIKQIIQYEEMADRMEEELSKYLLEVSVDGTLSAEATRRVSGLFSIINELERVCDIYFQMSQDVQNRIDDDLEFTQKQMTNLNVMVQLVEDSLHIMMDNMEAKPPINIDRAMAKEKSINQLRDQLRSDQIRDINKNKYNAKTDGLYKDVFHLCEKLADHVIHVSETLAGDREIKNITESAK